MKTIVLYSTKGGNTKKIADAIASELSCKSLRIARDSSISIAELNDYDLIFVGTGIYWGNPNGDMESYLERVDLKGTKTFALFVTWGGAGVTSETTIAKLKLILESKGQKVIGDYYRCYGGKRFSFLRSGHPNDEDAKAARKWAKNIVNNIH